MRYVRDVKASGRDVGGDEDCTPAGAEVGEGGLALLLGPVAVYFLAVYLELAGKLILNPVCHVLLLREYDCLLLRVDEVLRQHDLELGLLAAVALVDTDDALSDVSGRAADTANGNEDVVLR